MQRSSAAVDKYHRAFETAQAKNERSQRVWLLFGANTMLLAVVIAMLHTWLTAIPVAVAAGLMLAWSGRLWRRVDAARRAESDALDEVGADSYLTFQLTRLDRALDSEGHRKRVAHADSALRGAVAEWELLAGDVTVAWYLDHREAVEESALRLFSRNDRRSPMSLALPHPQDDEVEQLARLKDRLAEPAGDGGPIESLPVICDDPLVKLGPERKPQLLEALVDASTRRQVILLTGDPDVAAWARVEALTGEVGLVEAAPVR